MRMFPISDSSSGCQTINQEKNVPEKGNNICKDLEVGENTAYSGKNSEWHLKKRANLNNWCEQVQTIVFRISIHLPGFQLVQTLVC